MKSIKPGRGPSSMGAVGSIVGCIFGVFWTISAVTMGAPIMFPIFGVLFIGMGAFNAFYHFKNATSKNRFSTFDITDDNEEIDPLQARFNKDVYTHDTNKDTTDFSFCPYCGTKLNSDFEFCPKCGKKMQ